VVKKHVSVKERPVDFRPVVKRFLDELEVGQGVQYKNLNLYPIFRRSRKVKTDLISLKEALKEGVLEIKETGVVSEILAVNKSKDKKVLIVEGETVKGGAQNRVVNTTIIIMPSTREKIPTSCVQEHRWNTFDAPFKDTDYVSPCLHAKLASPIFENLTQNFVDTGGYGGKGTSCFAADQNSLWSSAATFLSNAGSLDESGDIHDAYETKKEDIDEWMKNFMPLLNKPIIGVVAEIDGALFADLSDTIEFAKSILPQVIKGYCLDAIVSKTRQKLTLDEDRVVSALERLGEGKIISGDSPNKTGRDVRIKTNGSLSNIFVYKGEVVHWVILKA